MRAVLEALAGGAAIAGMFLLIGWIAISKVEPAQVSERVAMLHDDTCAVHPDADFCGEIAK
jgi:hypothetical protein